MTRRLLAVALVGLVGLVAAATVGCNEERSAVPSGNGTSGAQEVAGQGPADGSAVEADDASLTSTVIPELRLKRLATVPGDWRQVRSRGDHLYAYRPLPDGNRVLGRFDPRTGALLVSRETAAWENYTVTTAGVVVLRLPERRLEVLDPDTLSDRRSVLLPDGLPSLNADLPRDGPFWVGLRQTAAGQAAGQPARMAIVRVDLDAGTVAEVRDVTPCGAKSAVQFGGRRVAFVTECAYQPAIFDLDSGTETDLDGFPDGAHAFAAGSTVWFRWKSLGYLGRIVGDRLQTLDLNADGPVIAGMEAAFVDGGSVWVAGDPAIGTGEILFRVDVDTFEVVARAWVAASGLVAFVDGRGYVASEGGLSTFDPADVHGGAPRRVVRPTPGLPPEATTDDPAERAVLDAFRDVFDPQVTAEQAASSLEDPSMGALRASLVELTRTVYPGAIPRATAVAVDGDTAAVNYVIERDGKLAFVPVSATLRRSDGRWVVTRDGLCRLVKLAVLPGC